MGSIGRLRPIADEELGLILSWRNDPGVRKNMYTRHEISMDEHLAWWERVKKAVDQQYFMYENEGAPRGVVGFSSIDRMNRHSFWAFYASPCAPRGTGTFMEFLALEHAFLTLDLHKLSCEVLATNSSVVKLHGKFGFVVEGIFRSHHNMDGEFVDVYRLGLLSQEWLGVRTEMQAKIERAVR